MRNGTSHGLSEPPEGVIAGENVPKESEPHEYDRALIEKMEGLLKSRGEPFISMSADELEQRAVEQLRKMEVDL